MVFGVSGVILNSLRDQLCLLDTSGTITFVNDEWCRFALKNGGDLSACGVGVNYLEISGQESEIHEGIRSVLTGEREFFNYEYPCHAPEELRWYLMQVTALKANEWALEGAVIRHVDVTKQKLLELQLKEYADTDSLTSVYNRRYFETQLTKETERSRKNGNSLALLYIDTDNFKEVNDTYGHSVGDKVLKELARLIKEVLRETDIFARLGGDEFAVLLPNTDRNGLQAVAERIIRSVRRFTVQTEEQLLLVTISVGGSSFAEQFHEGSMLEKADKALYLAKNKGKNQLVLL